MTAAVAPMNQPVQMFLLAELRASSLFAGRYWSNYRNAMMSAGICLAAVGAVASVALKATIAAITCVAFGIILLVSCYHVKNAEGQMLKNIQQLKGDNQQLKLKHETFKELGHAMAMRMIEMHRENGLLHQKHEAIQRFIPFLQARVDRSNDENQALGKEAGLLRQDIDIVVDDREDLTPRDAPESLREMAALSDSIARAQAIAQEIMHNWRRQREELTAQLLTPALQEDLAKQAHKIQEEQARMKDEEEALAKVTDQLEASNLELVEKAVALEKLDHQMEQIHNTLMAEKDELVVIDLRMQELMPQLQKMSASVLQMEGKIARRKHKIKHLDRSIQEKQHELVKINAEIAAAQGTNVR